MSQIVHVAYSHLFPGLRLLIPAAADEYILAFADGSRAAATLFRSEAGGEVLDVSAYTTTAGTAMPQRLWTVTEHTAGSLKLGTKLD